MVIYVLTCRLTYVGGRYLDAEGVTISTMDFGKISSLVDIADLLPGPTNASDVGEYLIQRGYVIDKSIRAAPYDWRLGAGTF